MSSTLIVNARLVNEGTITHGRDFKGAGVDQNRRQQVSGQVRVAFHKDRGDQCLRRFDH